jgi:hypothetical protein
MKTNLDRVIDRVRPRTLGDLVRWIGPIAEIALQREGECDGWRGGSQHDHPGGPAPVWGGYRPGLRSDIVSHTDWWRMSDEAGDDLSAYPYGDVWSAHMGVSHLRRDTDGWYVQAPMRLAGRCVRIAEDALRDGATRQQIMGLGISEEEVDEAASAADLSSTRIE